MEIRASFFGTPIAWQVEAAPPPAPSGDFAADLRALEPALAELAQQVKRSAGALGLDDYGLFRLAVFAVDALGGDWDARPLAVGAVLRDLGYAAVPFAGADGRAVLGVPTSDDDGLNADSLRDRLTITEGARVEEVVFHWLFWDGRHRLGDLGIDDDDAEARRLRCLHDGNALAEGPRGALAFFGRALPAFVLARAEAGVLALYRDGGGIAYQNRPDAAAYLDLFPQFLFPWQAALALAEAEQLGLAAPLRALAGAGHTEEDLINLLLRSYQDGFTYTVGPLRSLFETYGSAQADCDQLSLLVAVSLRLIGYARDDLRAAEWPHHMGLAIRPREGGPPGGASVTVDGARFYLLDLTYYYRDGDDTLISRWGTVSDLCKQPPQSLLELDRA